MNLPLLFLTVIWAWCAINVTQARRDITFDLTATAMGNIYLKPMQVLRAQMEDGVVQYYGIPVLRNPAMVQPNQRFVAADIIASQSQTLTLVIQVTDLYIVAYGDKVAGKDRISIFKSISTTLYPAIRALFSAESTLRNISVGESYIDLEKFAPRGTTPLGITELRKQIVDKIYGKTPIVQREEAKFLIIVAQMIAEAARFKYIENQVKRATPSGSFKPNSKTISLENKWDKISRGIIRAEYKNISPPLELVDPDDEPWEVTNVDQIVPDMGILKYNAAEYLIELLCRSQAPCSQ